MALFGQINWIKLIGIFGSIIMLILIGVAGAYYFRVSLIQQGFNQWAQQHQLEITALSGVEYHHNEVLIKDLELKHLGSMLALKNVKLFFNHWSRLPKISIEDTRIKLAYNSYLELQSLSSSNADSTPLPSIVIPNITIDHIKITLDNFPEQLIKPLFSTIQLQQLQINPSAQPMMTVNIVVTQQLNALLVAGDLLATVDLNNNYTALSWQLQSDNIELTHHDNELLQSLFIKAQGRIELKPQLIIDPIRIEINHQGEVAITEPRCRQLVELTRAKFNCAFMTDQDEIKLTLKKPISALVSLTKSLTKNSLNQFDVVVDNVSLALQSRQDNIDVELKQLNVNQQRVSSDWTMNGQTQRFPYFKGLAVTAAGQVTLDKQIRIKLAQVNLTVASYRQHDIAFSDFELKSNNDIVVNLTPQGIVSKQGVWQIRLKNLKFQDISMTQVNGEISSQLRDNKLTLTSEWLLNHQLKINSRDIIDFKKITQPVLSGTWQLDEQPITALLTIKHPMADEIQQQYPIVYPSDSILTTVIDYQVKIDKEISLTAIINGQAFFDTVEYQDTKLNGFMSRWQCGLLDNDTVDLKMNCKINSSIEQVDVGIVISHLNNQLAFNYQKNNNWLKINQFDAQLFEGEITASPFIINDVNDFTFNINLSDISLAEIVKLQQREGIKVTGLLSGRLPMVVVKQQLSINGGYLESAAPGGVIQITSNESVTQLRLSQPQLSLLFDTLEDFTYRSLTSTIDYKHDGWADFTVSILGSSPAIERPVEFNYSHQENILQLIRSLQIGDQISQQLEQHQTKETE